MQSSNRLVYIFGLVIMALILVTVILVLVLPGAADSPLLPADSPEGTVQRYLLAISNKNFQEAYDYLSAKSNIRPTYLEWQQPFLISADPPAYRVTIDKTDLRSNEAAVEVSVDTFRPGSILENPIHTNHIVFWLTQEETGWKIISPQDVWWLLY